MSKEEEIQIAWTICNLLARLNELLWDQYEDEFIKRYIKLEEQKYWESEADEDPPI